MKKPKEAPTTVVRQRDDDDPLGRGNYLNITGKRMLIRILYLFKIGLLCINSRSNLAKKKFRNVQELQAPEDVSDSDDEDDEGEADLYHLITSTGDEPDNSDDEE